jgi:hypothetical protein
MMHGPGHSGRIIVEGVEIPIMRLANGRLMCDFFMFQLFDSEEELATALRRTRGLLWDAIGVPTGRPELSSGQTSTISTMPN